MIVRELSDSDLAALSDFIIEAYNDYPLATWFTQEPSPGEIERMFYNKIRGIASGTLVDVVAEDKGTIAGECEIARTGHDSGVVGILVRHGYRNMDVGARMLRAAMDRASGMGMARLVAEVMEANGRAARFFARNGFVPIGYRDIDMGGAPSRLVVLQLQVSRTC